MSDSNPLSPSMRLGLLALVALACAVAFMTINAHGKWSFILPFRGLKLATMVLVGYAIAVSTVLFQTITHNRILTPSIMGFDALFILIQTMVVFGLGLGLTTTSPSLWRFTFEVVCMTSFAGLLFYWLFSGALRSLHLMMLVGLVCGLLFRSVSGLLMRLIDPNEFMILQARMFASFNNIKVDLILASLVAIAGVTLIGWSIRHRYDVLALGRDVAVNLGVPYQKTLLITLVIISVLVAVSTALVGPIVFFGLLLANLAYRLMGTDKHRYTLPAAILLGIIFLAGGQTILEHVLHLNTTISVIIEFSGGIAFLILLTRTKRS